jgi:hypothetical protein
VPILGEEWMTTNSGLRNFLLRKLPAADTERLENEVRRDRGLATQVDAERSELIDDYARGRLSADDAVRVSEYVLATPAAQQRLAAARAHAAAAHASQQSPRYPVPVWRRPRLLALLVASAVILGSAAWVLSQRAPRMPNIPLESAGAYPITLFQPAGRDAAAISVPAHTRQIEFQCVIPSGSPVGDYRVRLTDALGRDLVIAVSRRRQETNGVSYVTALYPAERVQPGHYTISVDPESNPTQTVAAYDMTIQ